MDKSGPTILLFTQDISLQDPVFTELVNSFSGLVQMAVSSKMDEFFNLLIGKRYDLILAADTSDVAFFEKVSALVHSISECTPLIAISGSIGEEGAVDLIAQGYFDFVHLSRLKRLHGSVLRATEHKAGQTGSIRVPDKAGMKRVKEFLEETQGVAHIGSWEQDLLTGSYYWSDEVYRIFGVEKESFQITSQSIMALRHKEDRQGVAKEIEDSLHGKDHSEYDYRIIRPDGELRYLHTTRKMHYDESGKPLRAVGVIQDITERKLAELELIQIEKNLEEAQGIAHIGSWERDLKTNETVWSKQAYRIYGLDPEGPPIDYATITSMWHRDDLHYINHIIAETYSGKEYAEYEFRIKRHDGEIRNIHSIRRTIYDSTGTAIRSIGTIQDVTEKRQRERDIQRAHRLLDEAQSVAHIGCWERDLITGELIWSDESYKIYGFDPSTQKPEFDAIFAMIHPDDREYVNSILDDSSHGKSYLEYGYRINRPDGKLRYLFVTRRTYYDPTGKATRAIGTVQDVTEKRQDELQAKRYVDFGRTIGYFAKDFINMPVTRIDEAIQHMMERLAEFCLMQKVAVYRYDYENEVANRLYAFDREFKDTGNALHSTANFTASEGTSRFSKTDKGYSFAGDDVPIEVSEEFVGVSGPRSVFAYPILDGDSVWGTLTMISASPQESLPLPAETLIRVFCEIFTNVVKRSEHEAALEHAYENNRLILDSISDGVGVFDRDGNALLINDHLVQQYYSEQIGIESGIFPKDAKHLKAIQSIFETGATQSIEHGFSGKVFYNRLFPVYKQGEITAVALFSTEITDTIKAQQEVMKNVSLSHEAELLREKEREYLEVLDTASDGAWVKDMTTGVITLSEKWNQKPIFKSIHTENLEEFILGIIHPEDVPIALKAQRDCILNHWPMYQYEIRVFSKGKGYIWALCRVKVVYGETGPVKLYGSYLDITERKRMEEALRQDEALLKAIIEGSNNPISLKDQDSRIILCNSALADLYGLDRADLMGKASTAYMNNKRKSRAVVKNERRVIESGLPETFEEVIPTIYGDRIFLSTKNPWRDPQGRTIGVIGVSQDITLQKNTERELRNTTEDLKNKNKLITDFITNLSHELRTPLSIIMMQLELINMYTKRQDGICQMIDIAWQNSLRLSRIVNNILDISRAEGGYLEVRRQYVDIIEHIRSICDSVGVYAQSKAIKVTFDSQLFCKNMLIDIEKVERILLNLLSNAIKYTPEGGEITITVRFRKRGDLILSVRDTGIGIPSEKLESIFDRFVRVDTSLNRENEGSGIGLALIKSLVEVLEGSIAVRSDLDKGSIFIVEIPISRHRKETDSYRVQTLNLNNRIDLELSDIMINRMEQ